MKKRVLSIFLCLSVLLSLLTLASCSDKNDPPADKVESIAILTSVKTDENGFFTGVDGEYRVYGVKVLDKESGEYRDLDLNKKYVLAGFNYHLLSQGDGMAMFKDAKPTQAEGTLDIELLENYIVDHLGGTIGEEYAEPQGRITFTEG